MFNKKLICLILFTTCNHIANSTLPLCISLGRACGPALSLRELKIRTEAYPFDWITSPFEALYNAINEDFNYFLTEIQIRPDNYGIYDHYGFHFTHDLPTINNPNVDALNNDSVGHGILYSAWQEALPAVIAKYARRIERFKKACSGHEKIFFIRSDEIKENILILRDLIKNKYPMLNFVIIAISNQESYREPWNLESIKNFYSNHWFKPDEWIHFFKQTDPIFDSLIIQKK